ncbi:MAG TPA: YbaY family lipoprotein [Blastocatellia bacterium]|nr:YbaY family lipoprotein [Blastocatellia bacterium]
MSSRVSGRIWFDDAAGQFSGATLRVKLEEVSRADAPARELSQLVISNCSHSPGEPPVDFILTADPIEPNKRYEVRAHLDIDGSGQYAAGDQITTHSYPVLTQGYPDTVDLRLQRIG